MTAHSERRWVWRASGGSRVGPCFPDRSCAESLGFSVLVVDKPPGPTSHDVVDRVRALLGVVRAGHGGTLDPMVTGVLPVFLGRATLLASLGLKAGKTYETVARLHGDVSAEALHEALSGFRGAILQRPPVRSRVKREERVRSIYALELLALEGREARLRVDCEAGTYVRKLIHDLGVALGTGAHMAWLRRTRAGVFGETEAVDLDRVAEAAARWATGDDAALRAHLRPPEILATLLPRFLLDEGAARAVASGAVLALPGILGYETPFAAGDPVALLDAAGAWVALGEAVVDASALEGAHRGLVAKPKRVVRPY